MTRSLHFVVALGFFTLAACSGASSGVGSQPEKDEDASEPAAKKSGNASNDGSSSQASPAAPAPSGSGTGTPAPAPAPPASAACAAAADALACVECCVKELPAIDEKTCTCDATAACKTECAGNLCDGKIPSFQCGQCLVQNAANVQACIEGLAAAPKKCVQDAQCLAKPGAEAVKDLPLPFTL